MKTVRIETCIKMKKISAEIDADSVNEHGNRITTMLLTYPKFIHGEVLTHRMFSHNSASSRAIPFEKMVKMVEEDPFIPIAWQKDHKGMYGTEYFTDEEVRVDVGDEFEYREDIRLVTDDLKARWLEARDKAINVASGMNALGLTKQLCNRLLEPFMWHTVLVTSGKEGLDNFYKLRCPQYVVNNYTPIQNKTKVFYSRKDTINFIKESGIKSGWENCEKWNEVQWQSINNSKAEIHMQALAEAMWDAYNESTPKKLRAGDWHIPFGDKINDKHFTIFKSNLWKNKQAPTNGHNNLIIKIATARCARLSYMTFDGEIDYEKDIQLHDRLLADNHMSPFENCARAMNDEEYYSFIKGKVKTGYIDESEHQIFLSNKSHNWGDYPELGWCNNFRGFINYRYILENNIQF